MAATSVFKKGSEEYIDSKCDICAKQKNKDEMAEYYCHDCQKHMCTSCLGTHNLFLDDHKVVKGKVDDKDVLTEKCGKHSDEWITFYCRKHDELICRTCKLLDHRSVIFNHHTITTYKSCCFYSSTHFNYSILNEICF